MSKQMKRILAALLMLAVMLGSTPLSVLAEDAAAVPEQTALTETPEAEATLSLGQMARLPEPMDGPTASPSASPSASASASPSASATPAPSATACAHSWGDWVDSGDMDCIDGGTQIRVCSICQTTQTVLVSGRHDYSVLLEMHTKPNCKTGNPGIADMKCSRCDATQLTSVPATHDYTVKVNTITEATCKKEGRAEMACAGGCGRVQTVDVPKTDHKMMATKVYTQVTCLVDGREDQTCVYCGTTRQNVAVKAYDHNYGESIREGATCTAGDRIYKKCSRCGDIQLLWSGDASPLNHIFGEVVSREADCMKPKRSCKICARCGEEDVLATEGKPLSHDLSNYVITREATCSTPGLVKMNCSRCSYSEEKIISMLAHAPANRTTEADCTTPSYQEKYCTACDQSLERQIIKPALGHKTKQETVGATCQISGTIKTICTVCMEELSSTAGTTVRHNTKLENLIQVATCTERGRGVYKCIWCDYRIYEYIPTLDHELAEKTTVVSCTQDGKIEIVCEVCKYVHSSAVTDKAPGHKMKAVEVIVQGSCEAPGVEHRVCEVCGYDAGNVVVYAPGHNFAETTIAPTCTEQGMRGVFCANCNEQKGEILEYIPATGHNMTEIPALAPTCTEPGHSTGEHCPACGMVTIEPDVIPATGHTEKVIPRVEPSCGVVGYTSGTGCRDCDAVLVAPVEIPALEHTIRVLQPVAPTCTKNGLKEGSICSTCKTVFVEQEEIPALGHTLEVVFGKDATCTESGLTIGEICSTCNEALNPQVVIPALGHTVVVDKGYAATCQKAGLSDGSHCSVCNAILQQPKVLPVLEHEWEKVSSKIYECTNCGEEVSAKPTSVTIDAENGIILAPGETLDLAVSYSPEESYSPLKWSTSAKKVATVDENGTIEAIAEGSATITVKTANSKKDTLKIKVVDPTKPTEVQLDRIGTVILGVGEELELYAALYPDTAESELKWTSSKPKYASVDEDGVVTALKTGTVTITVKTENGLKDTVKVKVVSATKPYSIALDQSGTVTLEVGDELQLYTEIMPATAESELTWTSSKKAVASVDEDGLVEALSEGTTTITVTTANRKKDSVKITVIDPSQPSSVELSEESTIELEVGEEFELFATIYPETADSELSWRSNRTKVATVDQDGLITAVGEGSATISVATENGKVASVRVKVVESSYEFDEDLDDWG
ncbi:MAG: Ig-like domain-containing protein [Clostridia bacterium]|nr:Ig-like domain-containing protein [Clostridia bacterium]